MSVCVSVRSVVEKCAMSVGIALPINVVQPGSSLQSSGVCEARSLASIAALHQDPCCTSVSIAGTHCKSVTSLFHCWPEIHSICSYSCGISAPYLLSSEPAVCQQYVHSPCELRWAWTLGRQQDYNSDSNWQGSQTTLTPRKNISRFQYITQAVFYHFFFLLCLQ